MVLGALLQRGGVSVINGKGLAIDAGDACMDCGGLSIGLLVSCMEQAAGGMGQVAHGLDLYVSLIRRYGRRLM